MKKIFGLLALLSLAVGCASVQLNPRNPVVSIPGRFLETPLLVRVTNDLPYPVWVIHRKGAILIDPACDMRQITCQPFVQIEAGRFQIQAGDYDLLVTVQIVTPSGNITIERRFPYRKDLYRRREREMGLVVAKTQRGFDLIDAKRSYAW